LDFNILPHCRRHTSLREAPVEYECTGAYSGRHKYNTGAIWKKDYNDFWWIGVCNNCHEPVLVLNKGDIIYPQPLPSPTDDRITELIRNDLNEAKICYSVKAYRASAVMSRRAMQSACIDKGATKEKLAE
jgi:hypothetical protein